MSKDNPMVNTLSWKEIWGKRAYDGSGQLELGTLIKLDGFDSGAGRIEANDWQSHTCIIADKLGMRDGDSVYEVGCGAGAFLYALRQVHHLTVGGLDYAASLIAAAKLAMPDGQFSVAEAQALDVEQTYDYVISNGVFHYFSQDDATLVLERMLNKAKVAVVVLEVPDLKTKQASEDVRRDLLSVEEYERKYAGLEHTYYDRDWFVAQAQANGYSCEIFDGCVPNYAQNRFRFGVIIRKS